MDRVRIKVSKLQEDARLPLQIAAADAGAAVHAAGEYRIYPGSRMSVETGLRVTIPEGHELQVRTHPQVAADRGVAVCGAPITVNAGDAHTLDILLINHSRAPVVISNGDKIALLVVKPVTLCSFEEDI